MIDGPVKTKILDALQEKAGAIVTARELCKAVYGTHSPSYRTALRNHVMQMRDPLGQEGLRILGRKEMRRNAYQLVSTL